MSMEMRRQGSKVDETRIRDSVTCAERSPVGQRACYKLVRAEVTWEQARSYCQNLVRGADLVSIESEQEQLFLVDAILGSQHSCERFHTSGRKNFSGVWVWQATGKPFHYTAWGPNEPSGNGNMCVLWKLMQKWTQWDDEKSTVKCCFIYNPGRLDSAIGRPVKSKLASYITNLDSHVVCNDDIDVVCNDDIDVVGNDDIDVVCNNDIDVVCNDDIDVEATVLDGCAVQL
ncbi:hypothetical protein LSAT2_022293 [Lamellibrachia satsuma]|nr:hypothetical protein LSAT2_022293 [Lamellibrachia satsuma]